MTRFNAGMASMEAKAKTATAKMSLAGMRMTKYLTLPIAAIGYASVKMATNFQSAMTMIQTQAGAPAKDLAAIRKGIMDMSGRSVMQGPTDLANAYYHLQSVFGKTVTVAGKLKMLKSIGQLAQIGGSSTEDTASAVAGILRTHLKGATKIQQVVRTINGIVGSGNMRMPQFVESTGTAVLQVARLLGMTLKQVGGAEAVFTDENMNANMSMTRLRTSLMMAVHPSQAAAKNMAMLGVSSLKIGESMRSKKGFASTLDYLSKAYDTYIKKLEDQGKSANAAKTIANAALFGSFGGSKGASIWATLVQQHQMYHQKEAQITAKEKNWNKDLAASSKTLSVQFKKAWASMQKALIDFGDALAPVVLGAAKALGKLANAFTNLPKSVQKIIMGVALALAVMGPMLILTSSLIKIFGDLGLLLRSGGLLGAGFGAVLPLAIIAAVGALVYFALKSKKFRKELESWGRSVQGFFHWLGYDVIGPFFFRLYKYFADGGKASRWKTIIIPAVKAVGFAIKSVFQSIGDAIKKDIGYLEKFMGFFYKLGGGVAKYLGKANDFAGGVLGHLGVNTTGKHVTAYGKGLLDRLHADAVAHHMTDAQYATWRHNHPASAPANAHHHGTPHHSGALVHVGQMNVRHESDAEIVAARIHRRMNIR